MEHKQDSVEDTSAQIGNDSSTCVQTFTDSVSMSFVDGAQRQSLGRGPGGECHGRQQQ